MVFICMFLFQSKSLLEYLILEKAAELRESIAALDPFPDEPVFASCRKMHQRLKYSAGKFTLKLVSLMLLIGKFNVQILYISVLGGKFILKQVNLVLFI